MSTTHTRHNYVGGATNFILRYADYIARVATMVSYTLRAYERFELDLLRHGFSTSRVLFHTECIRFINAHMTRNKIISREKNEFQKHSERNRRCCKDYMYVKINLPPHTSPVVLIKAKKNDWYVSLRCFLLLDRKAWTLDSRFSPRASFSLFATKPSTLLNVAPLQHH